MWLSKMAQSSFYLTTPLTIKGSLLFTFYSLHPIIDFALAAPITCNLAVICLFSSTHYPDEFENARYARC